MIDRTSRTSRTARPSFTLPSGVVIALCSALALPALAAPGVTPLQENKPIEVDGLAALANAPSLEEVKLSAALVKGKPTSTSFVRPVQLPGGQRVLAWSECSAKACLGFWAVITLEPSGDDEVVKVVARGPLPVKEKVHFDDGYTFQGSAVVSLDAAGKPMVLLHYQVTEPPRKQGGSLTHEYLDVLDPAARKVLVHQPLKNAGAGSEPSCSYSLIARNEKGAPAIEVKSSCAVRDCLEKTPTPAGCAPPVVGKQLMVLKKGGVFTASK